MSRKLQIKRGNKANLPTLDKGEFGLALDTNELFVGGNTANQQIAMKTAVDTTINGLQGQINGKAPTSHSHSASELTGALPIAKGGTGGTTAAAALTNLGLTASAAELNQNRGVTSPVQAQLNGKQATIIGAASSITTNNLTANKAIVSDSAGKVQASAITSIELGFLDGVTSNVQTQISGKAPISHSHPIAVPGSAGFMGVSDKSKLDGIEIAATRTMVDSALSNSSSNPVQNKTINLALSTKSDRGHTHSKTEVGLANVDNTSDEMKPISIAQQEALDLKATLNADAAFKKLLADNLTIDLGTAEPSSNLKRTNSTGLLNHVKFYASEHEDPCAAIGLFQDGKILNVFRFRQDRFYSDKPAQIGQASTPYTDVFTEKINGSVPLQSGAILVDCIAKQTVTVALNFPVSFMKPPNVVATVYSSVPEYLSAATILDVTATGCKVNLRRTVASTANRVYWMAAES